MNFFTGTRPKAPLSDPTDTIIPMYDFDDNAIYRNVLLYITLRFDNVLKPEKLRQSFERLMEIGDWRKLGARVRKTKQNKLEYHVPAAFTAKRPGFIYSHVEYNTSIQDHPVASRLPRTTDQPAIYSDLDNLSDLARRNDGPRCLDDFLNSDEPQLSLHIVSFTDSTLVSLSWLHTFMDAMAMSDVLNAWVMVLNDREEDVPPICNFEKDPMASFGTNPVEPYVHASHLLAGYNMFVFSIRYIFDLIFYRDSQRLLYLPADFLQSMKAAALKDLEVEQGVETKDDTAIRPYLSDGDILCAFVTRLVIKSLCPKSQNQIAILNPISLRSTLASNGVIPGSSVLLGNAVLLVSTIAKAVDIATKSVSYTASLIRKSMAEQGTYAQLAALTALTRKAVQQTGRHPVFGDGSTSLVIFSNWSKAKFFDLDFGVAVVGDEKTQEGDVKFVSKPSFVNSTGEARGMSPRGSWPILGKDQSGGYWILGNLRSDLWGGVERELEVTRMNELSMKDEV